MVTARKSLTRVTGLSMAPSAATSPPSASAAAHILVAADDVHVTSALHFLVGEERGSPKLFSGHWIGLIARQPVFDHCSLVRLPEERLHGVPKELQRDGAAQLDRPVDGPLDMRLGSA